MALRPTSPSSAPSFRDFAIDWGDLAPLRLRARAVAEGAFAGSHPSVRKGAGVEFAGYRAYTPGDDLRLLDRRALLVHDKLVVRELETETDRALWLLVDGSASMAFRGARAPAAKLAYAALLGAALARVALSSGDPVGVEWVGGSGVRSLGAMAGREAFERVCGAFESARAGGDLLEDDRAFERALAPVARRARRGAALVLLSDLLDLPPRSASALSALASTGRAVVVVQVLDPVEADLGFSGHVRLRAMEGDAVVEADADEVRDAYRERLDAITNDWRAELLARGGRLVRATTDQPAVEVVRSILQRIAEAGR